MDKIKEFLEKRENASLLRRLRPADFRNQGTICKNRRDLVDLSSNDYLGLSGHRRLKQAAQQAIEKFGTSSSASRLLSGDLKLHHELEEKIAKFKGKQAALIFNTGYQANIGIISALCDKGDAIFCDKLSHASIIDGAMLSKARLFRFRHNDVEHLENLLKKNDGKFNSSLVITESIFSMDGDKAPLKKIVHLKDKYDFKIMVDEAHATGIFGKSGSGIAEQDDVTDDIDLIMGTFSKALGSFGGFLACSSKTKEYLVNICRSFIYSTALPPSVIAVNITALDLVKEEPIRRIDLLENAKLFRNKLKDYGFEVKGQSQIVPLIIGDVQKAVTISNDLEKMGYFAPAIRPPTVAPGQSRLRFSLNYHHTKEMLNNLVRDIAEATNV